MCLKDEAHGSTAPFPTDLELAISLELVRVKVETQAGGLQGKQGSLHANFP